MLDEKFGDTLDQKLIKELCRRHAQKYEQEFMDDMRALGVRTPDALSRVSEYIPQIIEFIKKIMRNGYAYVQNSFFKLYDFIRFVRLLYIILLLILFSLVCDG
jgi:cysteinyl-tRNA synthetase